jgi:hypothetical protein
MAGWLIWIILLWAWAKSDSGNYIVFPQSKWKFPNGDCRTFDLKIEPDSWENIAHFKDGSEGYRVKFLEKYLTEDLDLPFPRIFNSAYWLLPAEWDKAFHRRAYGEFYHKGVFVTKPDCEDISVYVLYWERRGDQDVPVCIINDCAFMYGKTMQASEVPVGQQGQYDALYMMYRNAVQNADKIGQHLAYAEDRLEVAEKDSSHDFKHSADERMKSVRRRHARVMDVKEPLLTRILNLKNVLMFGLIILIVFLIGRLFLGLW